MEAEAVLLPVVLMLEIMQRLELGLAPLMLMVEMGVMEVKAGMEVPETVKLGQYQVGEVVVVINNLIVIPQGVAVMAQMERWF
jgi:hypothetical protein